MIDLYTYIHGYFNEQRRFTFPYDKNELRNITGSNGLYVLFEHGETFNDLDRIVRIGSHDGDDRLVTRLRDHFLSTKQRNSIFRKHIGRCLLIIEGDGYLDSWNKPFKKKVDRERYKDVVDLEYEKKYEQLISNHICNKLSFVVIPEIYDKDTRDKIEEGLISLLGQSSKRTCSETWLGNSHPDARIRNAHLWNIEYLKGRPLIQSEFEELVEETNTNALQR